MKLRILALILVCCLTVLCGCRGVDTEKKTEAAGLDGLIGVLLRSVDMREPVADASQLPEEDVWRFIIGTAGFYDGEYSDQPYNPERFPWEKRTLTRTAENGEAYEEVYLFLPMESVRQIAYEFFGISGYDYKDPAGLGADWDGFALPEGIGLNDFNTPVNMVREAGEGDSFTVTLELGPGGMGEQTSGPYERYVYQFRLVSEEGRQFVRFVRSDRLKEL